MYGPSPGNKTQITILACANAMGNMLTSMVIFNAKGSVLIMIGQKERFLMHCMVCLPMVGSIRDCLLNGCKKCLFQTYHQHGQSFFFWMAILLTLIQKPLKLLLMQKLSYLPSCCTLLMWHSLLLDVSFFGPLKKHWLKVYYTYT